MQDCSITEPLEARYLTKGDVVQVYNARRRQSTAKVIKRVHVDPDLVTLWWDGGPLRGAFMAPTSQVTVTRNI